MSTVRCKNCGAVFDAKMSYCPHCGTMNKRGAYAEFRRKISSVIDGMLGLKEDMEQSVSRTILSSLLRSLIFIAVIVGIGFLLSRSVQVNYYNDPEFDQKAYEEIVWMNENLDALNEAYENGDYKSIEVMYYQQPQAVRNWSHYPTYTLKDAYEKLEAGPAPHMSVYYFQQVMYFLFQPEYYTGYNGLNRVDEGEYTAMRDALIEKAESLGYPYPELEEIYAKCSDSFGYVDGDLLKDYIKEGGNG